MKVTYRDSVKPSSKEKTAPVVSIRFRTDGVLKSFTIRHPDGSLEEVKRDFNAGGFLDDVVFHIEE